MLAEPCGSPEIPALNHIYLNPYPGCNLHCAHCWVNEGVAGSSMDVSSWEAVMREAGEMGVRFAKFTGGEPLLYPRFPDLYRTAHRIFPEVAFETNGTVTHPDLFRLLAEMPPHQVSVSLDSSRPAVHDAFRGVEGSWRKTVGFINRLVSESAVSPQVIMSVNRPDRKAVADMVAFLEGSGVSSLKINLITPVGKGSASHFSDPDHIAESLEFLKWVFSEFPPSVIPDAPHAFIPVNRLASTGRCSVLNLLGILPDGTVSFCGIAYSLPQLAMGTWPRKKLKDIWENSPLLAELRKSLREDDRGICSRCVHVNSCMGKCIMENYSVGGSFASPHRFCELACQKGLFPASRTHG
ncbi:MAG: radical SAM protein [Candidatus Fermentibacteraceae bacterium]